MNIPAGAGCLNPRHPRLRVYTGAGDYEDICMLIQDICIFLGIVAFMLFVRALDTSIKAKLAKKQLLRIFPDVPLRNVIPLQRHRPTPVLSSLPFFWIGWFGVISIVAVVFLLFLCAWRSANGFLVNVEKRNAAVSQQSPRSEMLGVYVDAHHKFYMNGRLVARDELRTKLKEELSKRVVWTVYFEADENVEYYCAVYTFDTIRGLGAKVIWITPQIRKELNQQNADERRPNK